MGYFYAGHYEISKIQTANPGIKFALESSAFIQPPLAD
jgi:hypothetical protein